MLRIQVCVPGVKGGVSMVLVPKYGEKLWIPKSQHLTFYF